MRYYTTRFNSFFWSLGRKWYRFYEVYFKLGVMTCFILIPASLVILAQSLYSDFLSNDSSVPSPTLQPILPGVNIPASDIGLYLLSIFIASVIHEAGHALAAYSNGSSIEGMGFALFAIVPVAFVELTTDVFASHSPVKRLQIVCAGVWHNLILAFIAATLLLSRPIILHPLCSEGVSIVSSKLDSQGGLFPGDSIVSINNCTILDRFAWKDCFIQVISSEPKGYCVNRDFILQEKNTIPNDCCVDSQIESRNLCFINDANNEKHCLPVRKILSLDSYLCATENDCQRNSICVKPFTMSNQTRLVQIKRRNNQDYIYWGFPGDVFSSVTVVECSSPWISVLSIVHWSEDLLRYLISFSLAFGVLNVVPCFYLDGFWILAATLELKVFNLSEAMQKKVLRLLCAFGSLLLVLAMLKGFITLIYTGI